VLNGETQNDSGRGFLVRMNNPSVSGITFKAEAQSWLQEKKAAGLGI
jgi:hypothetical protein